jgi:hypothetical protein
MLEFVQRHAACVMGVISGFDRLLFRGTLRRIANAAGMNSLLAYVGVRLMDAGDWMNQKTEQAKKASVAMAQAAGRPVQYLNDSLLRKEELARQIAERDRIEQGLVCVLTSVEPCWSFEIRRNRAEKKLELVSRLRKCLHLYHYFMDEQLGLMHMRLQSWFPFTLWCNINGREWLARQLTAAGVEYLKRENCLVRIGDLEAAKALADEQLKTSWATLLDRVARQTHPAHETMFGCYPMDYYWSCQESEWATDVMFDRPSSLARIYPQLLRHGMQNLSSADVLRFLGKKVPASGRVHGQFAGVVTSDLRRRPEGMRIRHTVNGNSIKMYDKQGSVLRVETTITDPGDIKVYRGTESEPHKQKWRKMRKGVADLHRRAQVSQAANERYLQSLASAQHGLALGELARSLCRRTWFKGRPARGLNPLSEQDAKLLEVVNRGEFAINGFRNRDVRSHLYGPDSADAAEQRRRSAAVTRKLRLLRAHGLIRKIPGTHRYLLSTKGQTVVNALLAAKNADTATLMRAA